MPPARLPGHIQVSFLKQPEDGGVLFLYCSICKRMEIAHSLYACRPKDGGDAYLVECCPYVHFPLISWTDFEYRSVRMYHNFPISATDRM